MREKIRLAIQAALTNEWDLAISLNEEILAESPSDLATLNRLARAYVEVNNKLKAKEIYGKVLEIDRYNTIALKNLRLLPHQTKNICRQIEENFIEVPGLTKTVSLVKIGNKHSLGGLSTKQALFLVPKGRLISVTTESGELIGCLPDDVSFRINHLLSKNYLYDVCIKAIDDNAVTIFIRETKRPTRSGYLASFAKSLTYSKLKK